MYIKHLQYSSFITPVSVCVFVCFFFISSQTTSPSFTTTRKCMENKFNHKARYCLPVERIDAVQANKQNSTVTYVLPPLLRKTTQYQRFALQFFYATSIPWKVGYHYSRTPRFLRHRRSAKHDLRHSFTQLYCVSTVTEKKHTSWCITSP